DFHVTGVQTCALPISLDGEVASRYTDLNAEEHAVRHFNKTYLEIYVPVREYLSGRIIAVAEIHEHPGAIEKRLFQVRLQSWLVRSEERRVGKGCGCRV